MRTVTVHGKPYNVVYTYQPGRFPQRQHSFTHVKDEFGVLHVDPSGSGCTPKIAWRNFMFAAKLQQHEINQARLIEASGQNAFVVAIEAYFNPAIEAALSQPGDLSAETARRYAAHFYSVRAVKNPASLVGDTQALDALRFLVRRWISSALFQRQSRDMWRQQMERRNSAPPYSVRMHVAPDIKPETLEALGQLVTLACAAADRGEL